MISPTRSTLRLAAFTLIELLVVIGVIGALVSITLPAVFAARESSRRGQCLNNLRQLAMAVQNFENSFKKLPSSQPISLEGTPQPHGWVIYVTPYLEQQSLYDHYDFKQPWYDLANVPTISQRSLVFECPATVNPTRRDYAPPPATAATAATIDYATITQVDPRLVAAGLVDYAGQGMMPKKAQPISGHIQDGLSNTLMLIESAGRPQVWRRDDEFESPPNTRTLGGAWASPLSDIALIGSDAKGVVVPGKFAINRTNGEVAGNVYPHPQYGENGTGQIYSFHNRCANAAYADGSVHTVGEDVDIRVLARWVTRAGNEVIQELAD